MAGQRQTGLGGIPRIQPKWAEQAQGYLNQAGGSYSSMTKNVGQEAPGITPGGVIGAGVAGAMGMSSMAGSGLLGSGAAAAAMGGPAGLAVGAGVGLLSYFLG